MKEVIEKSIVVLSTKITADTTAVDALHYTQAILNLANAALTIESIKSAIENYEPRADLKEVVVGISKVE